MSRAYRSIRPRANIVYSVKDVRELYSVCSNTICNWIKSGLCPVDKARPQRFRGAELARFHEERRALSCRYLRAGEFKCLGCKAAVFPNGETLGLKRMDGKFHAAATCPDCGAAVMKILDRTECDMLQACLDTNTSPAPSDEDTGLIPARIGTSHEVSSVYSTANDRMLYDWQLFAGRYDRSTVDAHLVSIRDFEQFIEGKIFARVTTDDVSRYRLELLRRAALPKGEGKLSRSAVRHRASHLRQFFAWLCKQPGNRHLDRVPDYLDLPRKFDAGPELQEAKIFPSMDEAVEMLFGLPNGCIKGQRDRAMFAIAFLAGLRESALITLRVGDVDVASRRVRHDGRAIRGKNGKSFIVDWFPRTEAFATVLVAWIEEARAMGLRDEDALFPSIQALKGRNLTSPGRTIIGPMRTAGAVDAVFAEARKGRSHYTPHSARHTLAALGDRLCRTPEQRKAWSLNLGHSSVAITWTHYGRVNDSRKGEIFASFEVSETWTDEEMSLMLRYHEHQLYPGTPEFEHAERLVDRYRRKQSG